MSVRAAYMSNRIRQESLRWLDRGFGASLILHFIFFAVIALKAVFYPSEPIQFKHAIRVDMVALPDKHASLEKLAPKPLEEKPQEKKVEKAKLPEPKAAEPEKIDLRKAAKSQDSALKRLEALQKLKESARKHEPSPSVIKGNALSPGTALTGIVKMDFDAYLDQLDDQVKQHWNLPRWLSNANLKASLVIFIDQNGVIIKKFMKNSSGNTVFDEKCMEAVEKAVPFAPPPARLVNIFMVDGVELHFPE